MAENDRMEEVFRRELDLVTDLYKRTEQKTFQLLEEVEKNNKIIRSYLKKVWMVVTALALILSFFGIKGFEWVKGKHAKIEAMAIEMTAYRDQVEELKEEIVEIAQASKIHFDKLVFFTEEAQSLKTIVLQIQRIAKNSGIEQIMNHKDENRMRNLMIQYRLSLRELFDQYVKKYDELPYEVVFEAIITYVKILERGEVDINKREIKTINDAIISVLERCENSDWYMQLKCREIYTDLARKLKEISDPEYNTLCSSLELQFFASPKNDLFKYNIALILADLNQRCKRAIEILKEKSRAENGNPWQTCACAIGLIEMKDMSGWKLINNAMESDQDRFSAALLLAQRSKSALKKMGIEENLKIVGDKNGFEMLAYILESESTKKFRDRYSREYVQYIINKNLK